VLLSLLLSLLLLLLLLFSLLLQFIFSRDELRLTAYFGC
jgi:hypothetical protein